MNFNFNFSIKIQQLKDKVRKEMAQVGKILIIGANGVTGKFLIRHFAPKYQTVALLRSQPKFDPSLYPKLTIVKGDATDQETLDKVTEGISIILSCYVDLSVPDNASKFIQKIIKSIQKNSVKRFFNVTGMGSALTQGGIRLTETEQFPAKFKPYNLDCLKGYQLIAPTQINYTYIGCPYIRQEEKEGDYNVWDVLPKGHKWEIKAGSIAHFIEEQILNPKWERKIVGIANA